MVQAHNRSAAAVEELATRLDAFLSRQIPALSGGAESFHHEAQRHASNLYVIYVLLYAVVLIIGASGVLGLASTLATSVVERQREIALLRAIGASSRQIGQVFWTEGLALTAVAWAFGILFGVPLAYIFVQVLNYQVEAIDFALHPLVLGGMLIVVVLVATLASLVPAWQAARIRVVEMLRYE
jgi:putative ABC transport system permease protein